MYGYTTIILGEKALDMLPFRIYGVWFITSSFRGSVLVPMEVHKLIMEHMQWEPFTLKHKAW